MRVGLNYNDDQRREDNNFTNNNYSLLLILIGINNNIHEYLDHIKTMIVDISSASENWTKDSETYIENPPF